MALGINSGIYLVRVNDGHVIGLMRSTSFGRKRVALTNNGLELGDGDDHFFCTSSKRHCYQDSFLPVENSALEALPQDILVRILCGVEHDDLKRLFFVSKTIRETTVIAKQTHFAYSTPTKTVGFQKVDIFGNFDEGEAPNAPKQSRARRSRLTEKKLAGNVSVVSLASVFFPDPIRPLLYLVSVLVSAGELIHEVYQRLFVKDYGRRVPRFVRNLGRLSWFESGRTLPR